MNLSEFGKKPDFNPLRGSKSKFVFETRQPQASAPDVGRVVVRTHFCMCIACRPCRDGPGQGGDFTMPCLLKNNAAFRNIVGTTTQHRMERTSEVQGNTRELGSFFEAHNDAIVQSEDRGALERFAGTLKIGHIVAVVVANEMWETEEYTDDDFWLAIVMSEPRTLDSNRRCAGNLLWKGDLAFDCKWLHKIGSTVVGDEGKAFTFKVKGGKIMLDVAMVLQLPPLSEASAAAGKFYNIGKIALKSGTPFTLRAEQVNHILDCMDAKRAVQLDGDGASPSRPHPHSHSAPASISTSIEDNGDPGLAKRILLRGDGGGGSESDSDSDSENESEAK